MDSSRSLIDLAGAAMSQAASLLQTEASLARAEMTEHVGALSGGAGFVTVGVALLIPGVTLLLQAAASAVSASGMALYWSLAIFGGAAFILGLLFALAGRRRFRASSLKPAKTLDQLRRDALVARRTMGTADGEKRAA